MASRWYKPRERLPKDHDWLLVADTRFETPVKAKYHEDECWFEYSTSKRIMGAYTDEGYVQAWMQIPMYHG